MALKYIVPMSAVFMLVWITLSPNKPLLKLSCDHKCRVSICLIRATPDLFVVPLADDESERISGLPVNVGCFNCIPWMQLITNIPAAHPVFNA